MVAYQSEYSNCNSIDDGMLGSDHPQLNLGVLPFEKVVDMVHIIA